MARVDINMQVRSVNGSIAVVSLDGEIDVYTSPKVKDFIGKLIDKGTYTFAIDLQNVRYIDSTGLGVLIGGLKRVREHGGAVTLVSTNPQTRKIFDITGLIKVFDIYDSVDDAVNALK